MDNNPYGLLSVVAFLACVLLHVIVVGLALTYRYIRNRNAAPNPYDRNPTH